MSSLRSWFMVLGFWLLTRAICDICVICGSSSPSLLYPNRESAESVDVLFAFRLLLSLVHLPAHLCQSVVNPLRIHGSGF